MLLMLLYDGEAVAISLAFGAVNNGEQILYLCYL